MTQVVLLNVVAAHFSTDLDTLRSQQRAPRLTTARRVAVLLLTQAGYSQREISALLCRDRSTVSDLLAAAHGSEEVRAAALELLGENYGEARAR